MARAAAAFVFVSLTLLCNASSQGEGAAAAAACRAADLVVRQRATGRVVEGKPEYAVEVANRCRWVTLRLHPVGPPLLVPHHARQDTVVAGYDVPADARVLVHVRAIAPDPASWPDRTDAFLPERFLPGAGGCDGGVDVHGQHFELLPFGSGRRISPATNLAKKMVALGVASLLQGFAWRLPDRGREHGGAGQAVHTPEAIAFSGKPSPQLISLFAKLRRRRPISRCRGGA
ncbi:hypothetical protein OsI_35057 [Oryza sativa Indica Group]|uniref:Uncharacterized protein n=1 Tax=Oryza sativa subsp. indica TaxID=39946 RepID=B8BJ13_ORYSI|nr:hypothetical protein OsI_35057 [Oryza sativa Indica Group]